LVELFSKIITSEERSIEYIQSSLRSANAISKKGGHVTMLYRDQKFSLIFDNRRLIIDEELLKNEESIKRVNDYIDNNDNNDDIKPVGGLLDSIPLLNVVQCRNLRSISKKARVTEYNMRSSMTSNSSNNAYRYYTDLAIRNFVKGLISNPPIYPGIARELNTYDKIIMFILNYYPKIRISKSSISNLKRRQMIFKQVPRRPETLKFIDYVKSRFKDFDETVFFATKSL
jgi:hypothetical protein